MERIQPPPNYYGNPYPQTKDMTQTPYPPQMNGYNMPPNNYNSNIKGHGSQITITNIVMMKKCKIL